MKNHFFSPYVGRQFAQLRKLNRETLLFLLPPYDRMSRNIEMASKMDLVEMIVRARLLSL